VQLSGVRVPRAMPSCSRRQGGDRVGWACSSAIYRDERIGI